VTANSLWKSFCFVREKEKRERDKMMVDLLTSHPFTLYHTSSCVVGATNEPGPKFGTPPRNVNTRPYAKRRRNFFKKTLIVSVPFFFF
jgi:hypothetical protein